ncbi:MAG: hypothetical protein ACXV3A_05005 [Kineosporiaceae bacterium]
MSEGTIGGFAAYHSDEAPVAPVVLEALVDTIAPLVSSPVDELHVAALLESRGVTDRLARERYRHRDVFALASRLLPELAGGDEDRPAPVNRITTWRALVHGPLYLAPSLVIPALLSTGDPRRMLAALIAATVVGWLWGMATSVVGYQLRGQRREAGAASAIQLMTAAGLLLTALAATSLTALHVLDETAAIAMTLQTAYQLCAGVLVFYRRELVLAAAVLPGVTVGAVYLIARAPAALVGPTLVAAVVSVVLTLGAAWYVNRRAMSVPDGVGIAVNVGFSRTVTPAVGYAAAGAVLLLFTNAHFFAAGTALALAGIPLVLGMGAVEWRAERFVEGAADLLGATGDVPPLRAGLWRSLCLELATVLGILAALAAGLVAVLAATGEATIQGTLLTAGHVLLGGVFLLCFVLSRHEHFPWVVAAMGATVVGYVLAVTASAGGSQTSAVVELFLVTTSSLVVLLLGAFRAGTRSVLLFMW